MHNTKINRNERVQKLYDVICKKYNRVLPPTQILKQELEVLQEHCSDSTIYRTVNEIKRILLEEQNDVLGILLQNEAVEIYATYSKPIIIGLNPSKLLLVEDLLHKKFNGKIITIPQGNYLSIYILKNSSASDTSDDNFINASKVDDYYREIGMKIKQLLHATPVYATEGAKKK